MFVIWSAPSPLTIAALLAAAQTWRATLPLRPDARFGGLNGCGAADALAALSRSRRILCRRKPAPLTGGANRREIRANPLATFKAPETPRPEIRNLCETANFLADSAPTALPREPARAC